MTRFAKTGRLSTMAAALVVARRDFTAILLSRSFLFFLLGPLFVLIIGTVMGGIGHKVQASTDRPELGVAMSHDDVARLRAAHQMLAPQLGHNLPVLVVIAEVPANARFDAGQAMRNNRANLAAVLTGTLARPQLTGPADRIGEWQGWVALLSAQALRNPADDLPAVTLTPIATSKADQAQGRVITAQLGQSFMFFLTMILSGMVLSNLVEEKSNKIIEVLAAAIPMDAVFLGKLFAMLAVSWVGIGVWAVIGGGFWGAAGHGLGEFPVPAVGWPIFLALGAAYFSLSYLLIGSIFLALGSLAATVRDVQTISMPATMLQLLNFFFASYAIARPGSWVELAAIAMPFSSPFAMLSRAALSPQLWPHLAAMTWQIICVVLLVRAGARLFRTWVMKSGPAGAARLRWWRRRPEPDPRSH